MGAAFVTDFHLEDILMVYKGNDWLAERMVFRAMLLVVVLLYSQSAGADSPANGPDLKVATCQFPVSGDVDENARYIKDFIKKAAANQADVVQFSEAALSGYAGVDIPDFDNYDWDKLRTQTREIMSLARDNSIWASALPPPIGCKLGLSRPGTWIAKSQLFLLSSRAA